jgi:nitrogen regulatory protein PII
MIMQKAYIFIKIRIGMHIYNYYKERVYLQLLTAITDYTAERRMRRILSENGLHYFFSVRCFGTADSSFLEILGLGENEKTAFFIPAPDEKRKQLYVSLERKLRFKQSGTGIAFALPIDMMSAAIRTAFYPEVAVLQENVPAKDYANAPYRMILTITDRGNYEKVKAAASAEGARGGTVFKGLGTGGLEAAKFLGISISPEKDITLIIVPTEDCPRIMHRITAEAGLSTEGRGVCFALPVSSAFGLAEKIE